ncbi:hypothetical protein [Rugosimonospora acidiphila]|uniref:hypothetical protein n=1 Tax=Rugosimonospora acidiphila TaxID=556531 RepID=UPI0031EC95C5
MIPHLGRVDARLHAVERFALGGQLRGLVIRQPARVGELGVDGDKLVEVGQVLRRADGQQDVWVAHSGLAAGVGMDPFGGAEGCL